MKAEPQQEKLLVMLVRKDDGNIRTDFYLNDEYTKAPVTLFFGRKGALVTANVDGREIRDVRINTAILLI